MIGGYLVAPVVIMAIGFTVGLLASFRHLRIKEEFTFPFLVTGVMLGGITEFHGAMSGAIYLHGKTFVI